VFGLRYHVASLAAVFLALAVGILLGVALSGKISEADEALERNQIQDLEQDLQAANERADSAARRGESAQELLEEAYPTLMEGRLEDTGVAAVFLGPVDQTVRADVERALRDAGSGRPVRVVALEAPLDVPELQSTLEGDEALAAYAEGGGDFGELGKGLGSELAEGGETPLWEAIREDLVVEQEGSEVPEVEGAIVVATWTPETSADGAEPDEDSRSTQTLLDGLVQGLASSGVPVVGVATTGQSRALTELYRDQGISSVDNVDEPEGRLALALLLAQAQAGHYGVKDTAEDGVVPPFDSLPDEGE
jgi:hypothetical protein